MIYSYLPSNTIVSSFRANTYGITKTNAIITIIRIILRIAIRIIVKSLVISPIYTNMM